MKKYFGTKGVSNGKWEMGKVFWDEGNIKYIVVVPMCIMLGVLL